MLATLLIAATNRLEIYATRAVLWHTASGSGGIGRCPSDMDNCMNFGTFLVIVAVVLVLLMVRRTLSNKKLAVVQKEAGREFLAANAEKEGVITTDSGLQYQVLQAGTGEQHPGPKSKVTVHYHGTLIDGTVFDSSVDRGQTISFPLNRVIRGWTEGVQLMVVGEKTRFFIPSELAYGDNAAGKILPGSVLIFDIELFAIDD